MGYDFVVGEPQPIEGMWYECYDGDVLRLLTEYPPKNEFLKSAFEYVRRISVHLTGVSEERILMTYSRKHGNGGYGRWWADAPLNLQTCPKILRPLVCGKLYHDVDIANCHPRILLGVAKRLDVSAPALERYTFSKKNRERILLSIMEHYGCTRCLAKQLILMMLNTGKPKGWKEEFGLNTNSADHDFILELLGEVRTLQEMMLRAYPHGIEVLREYNKHAIEKKRDSSAFSWALQELENKMVMALKNHFVLKGWRVDVLVFDGVMVRRQEDRTMAQADLDDAECAVNTAMAEDGITIELEEKPMTIDPVAQAWLDDARRGGT